MFAHMTKLCLCVCVSACVCRRLSHLPSRRVGLEFAYSAACTLDCLSAARLLQPSIEDQDQVVACVAHELHRLRGNVRTAAAMRVSTAAPSRFVASCDCLCSTADFTDLETLPESIGELSKLKTLCAAAHRFGFAREPAFACAPAAAQGHQQLQTNQAPGKYLRPARQEPVRPDARCLAATSVRIRPVSAYRGKPCGCSDVSYNYLSALPGCMDSMLNLTVLYAPPRLCRPVGLFA